MSNQENLNQNFLNRMEPKQQQSGTAKVELQFRKMVKDCKIEYFSSLGTVTPLRVSLWSPELRLQESPMVLSAQEALLNQRIEIDSKTMQQIWRIAVD